MNHWSVLQIAPTQNIKAIKTAYAALLKLHKPEQDPVGYQRLREAFDAALTDAKNSVSMSLGEAAEIEFDVGSDQTRQPSSESTQSRDSPSNRPCGSDSGRSRSESADSHRLFQHLRAREMTDAHMRAGKENSNTSAQIDDEIAMERQVERVLAEIERILHQEGEEAACLFLKNVLLDDPFIRIDRRAQLDARLFAWAVSWREPFAPGIFFEFLLAQFNWVVERNDATDGDGIRYLQERIAIAKAYCSLIDCSRQPVDRGSKKNIREAYAAQLLLGNLDKSQFPRLAFTHSVHQPLRKILQKLKKDSPQIFKYELDTPTAQWYLQRMHTVYFSARHLKVAFATGVLIAATHYSTWRPLWAGATNYQAGLACLLAFVVLAGTVWAFHAASMAAARGFYRVLQNLVPVLYRHYTAIKEQIQQHTWAYNGMFALTFGVVAQAILQKGWVVALLYSLAFPLSILLWNELFLPVTVNALLVLATMYFTGDGKPVVMPGYKYEYVVLLTFMASHFIYSLLDALPESWAERISARATRMLVLFICIDFAVVSLFWRCNEWLAG